MHGHLLLRLALAFAFLYPPVSAYFNPYNWLGYFPEFTRGLLPDLVLLHLFGFLEIAIGVWLLYGKHLLLPSTAAALLLLGIVVFNLGQMDVLFRDISLLGLALYLALESYREMRRV